MSVIQTNLIDPFHAKEFRIICTICVRKRISNMKNWRCMSVFQLSLYEQNKETFSPFDLK